jgi:hypothetical protein
LARPLTLAEGYSGLGRVTLANAALVSK